MLRDGSTSLPPSSGPRLATQSQGVTPALSKGCAASQATAVELTGLVHKESSASSESFPAVAGALAHSNTHSRALAFGFVETSGGLVSLELPSPYQEV